jgi:hypothetical protein
MAYAPLSIISLQDTFPEISKKKGDRLPVQSLFASRRLRSVKQAADLAVAKCFAVRSLV